MYRRGLQRGERRHVKRRMGRRQEEDEEDEQEEIGNEVGPVKHGEIACGRVKERKRERQDVNNTTTERGHAAATGAATAAAAASATTSSSAIAAATSAGTATVARVKQTVKHSKIKHEKQTTMERVTSAAVTAPAAAEAVSSCVSLALTDDIEDVRPPRTALAPNFYDVWNGIKEMRSKFDAPVDLMGTECLGDRNESPEVWRFQTLVACMLSSQTKDEATAECMTRLKKHGLTVENIHNTSEAKLKELLYGVGFHNTKARSIRAVCKILRDENHGDIPTDYEGLLKLPGVGPKMANIVASVTWHEVQGIAVDSHVHRICNRLGWVKTSTPEKTMVALQDTLPRDLWKDFNLIMVGFGQQVCKPVSPKCLECRVQHMCPVGQQMTRAITN
eukprot:GHVQ01010318.1.p1 GENE.GHVQ01010318.1~~GHVQ01010318.1.p1  ORF type:complete len:390 (-),score=61.73 GHVQ01010318.1:571-1740(-)